VDGRVKPGHDKDRVGDALVIARSVSDEAIHPHACCTPGMDCFAALAMTDETSAQQKTPANRLLKLSHIAAPQRRISSNRSVLLSGTSWAFA